MNSDGCIFKFCLLVRLGGKLKYKIVGDNNVINHIPCYRMNAADNFIVFVI